jgi:3-phosphoshikimate 1-carboxyvinyltransferase
VTGDRAGSIHIQPHEAPELIDDLSAIAVLAAHSGEVRADGATELRAEESDHVTALAAGLRALGVEADERPDGFTIHGSGTPPGGVAGAAGDDRLALTFAIAPSAFETLGRLVA